MPCRQAAGVPSGARDAVIAPYAVRFAIQKIDRLHIARMEERHKEIAHQGDILDVEHDPVCGSLCNVHAVDSFAGKVVNLLQVEHLARLHLISREIFAALSWLRTDRKRTRLNS